MCSAYEIFVFVLKSPSKKSIFYKRKKSEITLKTNQNINNVHKIPKQTTKIVLRSKKSKTKQKPGSIFTPIIENKFLAI